MQKQTKPVCPKCGAGDSIPIAYGYPGDGMKKASRAGEIELGGCIIRSGQPNRACRVCRHRWRENIAERGWPAPREGTEYDDE